MTREQLIEAIKQLSLEQKLELLEAISRSIREELHTNEPERSITSDEQES